MACHMTKIKVGVPAGLASCNKAKIGVSVWLAECKRLRLVSRIAAGGLPDDSRLSIGVCRSVLLDGSRLSIAVAA